MLIESQRIQNKQLNSNPDGIVHSIQVKRSNEIMLTDLIERIISVWKIVSDWGRWCNEELVDWPETSDAINQLPTWFAEQLKSEPDYEITNWMDDLHDRNWIWWSGNILDDHIKIVINCESMPVSLWTLEYVINKAGGQIIKKYK